VALHPTDLDFLRSLLARHTAIVFAQEKNYLAESRLHDLARREGIPSAADIIARLRSGPPHGLLQKVLEAMTTNETSFFRDAHPFEALRRVILPEFLQRRAAGRRLSIWCAASSTGQEPYSLALLLREYFPQLQNWSVRILATDLSRDVLTRARQGIYSQFEVSRGLPPLMLTKYFQSLGEDWQLNEEIRSMVEFRQLNLFDVWPNMLQHDLIFLRNVLIYFDVPAKKSILAKIRQHLQPDGYLFLGGSESVQNLEDGFERATVAGTSCYRRKP
jgi:chemotaxis protein methyltransferase CheR